MHSTRLHKASPPNNVKDGLAPAFESQPREIVGADCLGVLGNERLMLLPGHIELSEYETTLGIAQELSGSLLPLRNLPGSPRSLAGAQELGAPAQADLRRRSRTLPD